MSIAIVPGSFDPMTLGHLDVIRYSSEHYDEVVVAVMINREKIYRFDMKTRVEIAKRSVAQFPNVRVISDEGMLIDLFDRLHADAVCKGYRNGTDYEYEQKMAEWNRAHNPRFRTVLIPADRQRTELSSTQVRGHLDCGADIGGLVHPDALDLIKETIEKNDLGRIEK